jgi:hypothetical protein
MIQKMKYDRQSSARAASDATDSSIIYLMRLEDADV